MVGLFMIRIQNNTGKVDELLIRNRDNKNKDFWVTNLS